jgi:hypothetical protein
MSPIGYLLFGLFVAFLLGVIVWALLKRETAPVVMSELDVDTIASPGDLRPSQVPRYSVEAMMARARKAAGEKDYKNAVGFAYLAGIDHLHRVGVVDLRRSTTNLQIVDAAVKANGLHRPTATLVRIFEDLFFGEKTPLETHWDACRRIVEEELVSIAEQD